MKVYDLSMANSDSFVRLVNLFELLSNAKVPLTMEEIYQKLPDLPEGPAAKRQAVERAKSSLKALGIPLRTELNVARGTLGYLIDPDDLLLNVEFTAEEEAALAYAIGCLDTSMPLPSTSLQKLGFLSDQRSPVTVTMPTDSSLGVVLDAVSQSKVIEFDYGEKRRVVEPYGLVYKWGRWYIVGVYEGGAPPRTFRADRITSPVALTSRSFVRPTAVDLSLALPDRPTEIVLEAPITAVVIADGYGGFVLESDYEISEKIPVGDDLYRLTLEVVNPELFVREILGLAGHLKLSSPREIYERVSHWLAGCTVASESEFLPTDSKRQVQPGADSPLVRIRENTASKTAMRKFELLSSLLPYLAHQRIASLNDLSKRFGIEAHELIATLETAATCGVPPYSPECLFEILVDPEEDLVEVRLDTALSRRRRFDYSEALVVVGVSQIIQDSLTAPSAALDSALMKLRNALGEYLDALGAVEVETDTPSFLGVLRQAVSEGRSVQISYHSSHSQRDTHREVEPYRLFMFESNWYLHGYCHLTESRRTFRASRMSNVEITETHFKTPEGASEYPSSAFDFGPDSEGVDIWVDELGLRALERDLRGMFNVAEASGSHLRVNFRSYSRDWLRMILVQLGPGAIFADPQDPLRVVQRDAALQMEIMFSS